MKILLIQPKMNKRPMDTDLKTRMSPSLALLTLLKLTPAGHEVIIINENVEKIKYDLNIDMVGITVTLDVMPRACRIAQEFRKRAIPVIAGGIHITCCPDECQPHFDSICVGPAERVWSRIIKDVENSQLKLRYSDMENFQGNEISSPMYSHIDRSKYLYTNVLTTSRGCPNRCSFCYNSCINRIYVRRPINDVVCDIKSLGTRHIFFVDDNFIGDTDYTYRLLDKIKSMNLVWSAAVTTKILDDLVLLDLMKNSGCRSLFIGFESINKKSLDSVNKANRVEQYERLVKEIHKRGIMINASMVFGLDGDGPDTYKNTLDWLVKMRIETLTSHILTPYPGTEVYKRMEKEGRITDHNLENYNTAHVVFKPAGMTQKQLYEGYIRMYRDFYSLRNIIKRMPQIRDQRGSYLLFNFFYRKFGWLTAAVSKVIPLQVIGKLAARISFKV